MDTSDSEDLSKWDILSEPTSKRQRHALYRYRIAPEVVALMDKDQATRMLELLAEIYSVVQPDTKKETA